MKETISHHKHVCKLPYSWKIALYDNADFVLEKKFILAKINLELLN